MENLAYSLSLNLHDFRDARQIATFEATENAVSDGEILVKVDKLALTANSISYGLAGKSGLIRYLDIFPATEGLANLPCWGYADIVASKHPQIEAGTRIYGFFPIASHVIMAPGEASRNGFTDTKQCRTVVPAFYNEYAFTKTEPGYAPEFEETIMMFRPLFGTSFLMQSYCEDHHFHGASRVIVTSASAKTAMGFGYLMKKNFGGKIKTIGLTSSRNFDFVTQLDCFDSVLSYDDIAQIASDPTTLIFDVAGNSQVVAELHQKLGGTISYSGSVGKTHWDSSRSDGAARLPVAKPVFWSGPDQIGGLRERLGISAMWQQMGHAMADFMISAHQWIEMKEACGPEPMTLKIRSMLDDEVGAHEGVILRP